MKKLSKIFLMVLFILIFAIGCKNVDVEGPNTNEEVNGGSSETGKEDQEEESKEEENEVEEEGENPLMDAFLDLIKPWMTASDLGLYIRDNIGEVNEEDGEEMLKWLLVYQTEMIHEYYKVIFESEYIDALDQMEWVLDEDHLGRLENKEMEDFFKALIDGYLTIIRYGDTPAVETDWRALNSLPGNFSEDLGQLLGLYQKIQRYEYERFNFDAENLFADMLKTEAILVKNQSGFLSSLANEIYEKITRAFLVGPEGSYISMFYEKKGKEYDMIIKEKNKYPDSLSGKMITDLSSRNYDQDWDVFEALEEYLQFGITSDLFLKDEKYNKGTNKYTSFKFVVRNDKDKENRLNKIVDKDLDDLISSLDQADNLNVLLFHDYYASRYISYSGNIYYNDTSLDYNDFNRTFDYINEKYISLDEYLATDFNNLKAYLKSLKGIDIDHVPDFSLNNSGIQLIIDGLSGMDKFLFLSKKDLVPFLNLDDLIIK